MCEGGQTSLLPQGFTFLLLGSMEHTKHTVHCKLNTVQCTMDDTFIAHNAHWAMSNMQDPLHHFEGWTISDDLSSVSSSLNV